MKYISILLAIMTIVASCSHTSFIETKENDMDKIYEKKFVEINGYKQGMFIKGDNKNNPVLLFLHGGPAMPEYGLTQKYPTYLEKYFVVCWYEQRNGGLSYNKNSNLEELTVENIVKDTLEMANYLRNRFNKDKIYLMGHSWGTLIGIKAIYQNPEPFYAYIGVAQITNQLKSEQIAYEYMLSEYKRTGNKSMVKKLEKYNLLESDSVSIKYAEFRDKPMHELGIGSMHEMDSVISGIFLPIMRNKEYTFSERVNIWRAKSICLNKTNLWETMINTDLTKEITEINIPIYFFHGIYDYTVNYDLAKEYFSQINAPVKSFYVFNNSAHSPIFEEPEKVGKIILEDVLNSGN